MHTQMAQTASCTLWLRTNRISSLKGAVITRNCQFKTQLLSPFPPTLSSP